MRGDDERGEVSDAASDRQTLALLRRNIERLHREMNNAGGVDPYWVKQIDDLIGILNGEEQVAS